MIAVEVDTDGGLIVNGQDEESFISGEISVRL